MNDLFKRAAKDKVRFDSTKGSLSAEDLFDLSLESLDVIAKRVNKQLKTEGEESFIGKKSRTNTELELKLDILKDVIKTKQDEDEARKTRAEKREKLENLKVLLADKELEEFKGKSKDEILKEITELEEA